MHLKDLPKKPTRFCVKKTGPLDVNFIINAIIGNSQLITNIITIDENTMSTILFQVKKAYLTAYKKMNRDDSKTEEEEEEDTASLEVDIDPEGENDTVFDSAIEYKKVDEDEGLNDNDAEDDSDCKVDAETDKD